MSEIVSQCITAAKGIAGLFFSPGFNLYWGYVLGAIVVASLVYMFRYRRKLSLAGLYRYLFPVHIWLHRSSRNDLAMFLINTIAYSFLIVPWLLSANTVADKVLSLLIELFGATSVIINGQWAVLMSTVLLLLVADLAFFISHTLQHKIPLLWEFHKAHHSAEVLTPLTALRRHPVDMIIDGTITGLLVGIFYGVMDYLSGSSLNPVTFMGVNAGLFLFLVVGFNLQHSHVWLSYGRHLDHVFISPALHQVHHSNDPRHYDKNMGNIFAVWDWMLGSLYVPTAGERLGFGLAHSEERYFDNVLSLYVRPLVIAWRRGHKLLVRLYQHTKQPA